MKGIERLSGHKSLLDELAAEEKLERIIAKAVEETKTTPRPEKVQKIIDAKRKKELEGYQNAEVDALVQELEEILSSVVKKKAHGGIVDKAIVGGERYI